MRKLLCGIALGTFLAIGANLASAQSGGGPGPGGWHHGPMNPAAEAEHLAKRLGLSSEQETQVVSLLTSQRAEMKALDENQTITHQQFKVQTKALHEQTETKIEALLTETQKTQFAEMKSHMGRGPGGDEQGPPPPPPSE